MLVAANRSDIENLQFGELKERSAVYFESMDYIDYVRCDGITVSERVDEFLTIIWDKNRENIVGFRLKGIKNFFLVKLKPALSLFDSDFIHVRDLFVGLALVLGDEFFSRDESRRKSYKAASEIAERDNVSFSLQEAA